MIKWIKKNIGNVLFITFVLLLFFVPATKAILMRGLMKAGFFKPKLEQRTGTAYNLAGLKFINAKGEPIDLGDFKGKTIFINFWATWCPPCLAEMPSLNYLHEQLKNDDHYLFLFVDVDNDLIKSLNFMQDKKFDLPVYTQDGSIPDEIFKDVLPTTVIFDKHGRLVFKETGLKDYSDKKMIDFVKMLKEI